MPLNIIGLDRRQWILQNCELGKSIIDVGGNDGHIFNGTPFARYVTTVDLDVYQIPNFYRMSAEDLKFPNKYFDLAILAEILEHANNPIQVLKEASRVAKRILITVPDEENWSPELFPFETLEEYGKRMNRTVEQLARDNNPTAKEFYTRDNYKHLFHNRYYDEETLRRDLVLADITDYKLERLQYGNPQWSFFVADVNCNDETAKQAICNTAQIPEVVSKTMELAESNNQADKSAQFSTKLGSSLLKQITSVDHMVKLNIGSFTVMHSNNWINLDILDLVEYSKQNNFIFKQADCSTNIPYQDNSVDIITASHYIEHLDRSKGKLFLKESFRILKPNGIIRLTVPDARIIINDFLTGTISRHSTHNVGVKNAEDDTQSLYELLIAGHQTIYEFQSLSRLLERTGFIEIEKLEYHKSRSKTIQEESIDMYPELSLYVEAMKPAEASYLQQNVAKDQIYKQFSAKADHSYTCNGIPIETTVVNQQQQQQITCPSITYGPDSKSVVCDLSQDNKLRIALISTPFFQVPPSSYGGLEQVVWDLAMGLDELGHNVTIFGPEGSKATPHGKVVYICKSHNTVNVNWYELEKECYNVFKDIINDRDFDIIHSHEWFGHAYLLKQKYPNLCVVSTHHGGYSWESPPPFGKGNLVAISFFMQQYTVQYFAQKGYNVDCKFVRNGIDLSKYSFQATKTENLLFVGRLSQLKNPHIAIEVARRTNHKLNILGGTFVESQDYVNQLDKMVENDPNIKIFKNVSHEFKIEKMQNAKAIIIPSKMGDPLNLVSIEGQACGTPILAFRDGGLPETIMEGKTGFVCDSVDDMVKIIDKINTIDPSNCRKYVEDNFSRLTMAKSYEKLYYELMKGEVW